MYELWALFCCILSYSYNTRSKVIIYTKYRPGEWHTTILFKDACTTASFSTGGMDRSTTVNHDHLLQYMVNFNPIGWDYIVRWQSDLENTKERPLHKIKANLPNWAEFEILRNGALVQYSYYSLLKLIAFCSQATFFFSKQCSV